MYFLNLCLANTKVLIMADNYFTYKKRISKVTKQVFFLFLLFFLFTPSSYANNVAVSAKSIIINKILDEIILLKQRKNTDSLIHASFVQIDCIQRLSDIRYGLRDCKKIYKHVLFKERLKYFKNYKD
jgi:hypothetical protein